MIYDPNFKMVEFGYFKSESELHTLYQAQLSGLIKVYMNI